MAARPTPPPVEPPSARCRNCGAPMLGDYCHACGQPQRSPFRHLSDVVGEFVDHVLNLDNRLWRTLRPLYFRPGHLTAEYLAGRRMRYVAPLRLYLFLSLLAFVVIAASTDLDAPPLNVQPNPPDRPLLSIEQAPAPAAGTPAATLDEAGYQRAQAELEQALAQMPVALRGLVGEAARAELERRRALAAVTPAAVEPGAAAHGDPAAASQAQAPTAPDPHRPSGPRAPAAGVGIRLDGAGNLHFDFGQGPWDPVTNPLRIGWLPDRVNAALNAELRVLRDNALRVRDRPDLILRKALSLAPTALLLVLPLVAVLLKLAYVGSKRLYLEHLIVALHSHSFLCLSLILAVGLDWIATLTAGRAWIATPAALLEGLVWAWIPLHLLLMLKRVYAQGWTMTVSKAALIALAYLVLLAIGFAATFFVSLAVL